MIRVFVETFISMIGILIGVDFVSRYFTYKYSGRKKWAGFYSTTIIYLGVVLLFNFYMPSEGLWSISYSVILFIYACFFLKGALLEKAIVSVLWNIITLIAATVALSTAKLVVGREYIDAIQQFDGIRICVLITGLLIRLILTTVILILRKKDSFHLHRSETISMVIIYALLYGMVLISYNAEVFEESGTKLTYFNMVILIGFIGISIFTYFFFLRLSKSNKEKMEAEFELECENLQNEYLEQVIDQNENIHILWHDMKGQLKTVQLYLENHDYEEAILYISNLDAEMKDCRILQTISPNKGVSAAITKAMFSCRKSGIDFEFEIFSEMIEIPEMDISNLLTNMLNNSIEACEKVDGTRIIKLIIQTEKNYIHVEIKNSITWAELESNPKLETTKKNKYRHGFGTKSIQRIADKYDGEFQIREQDAMFIQDVFLKRSIQ